MMKCHLPRLTLVAALCLAGAAHAADVGRVLLAAGNAVAIRGNQTVKLAFGTAIQDKDLLRTGPASNLQVRFIDESIVSMKEASELRIDEFQFSGKEDGKERGFFSLLKGGLRAVTGLVGRSNNANYRLSTTTATIGIRGTDYAATLCQGDCRNNDGSPAKDGLYGRVLGLSHGTNRIDVSNERDSKAFGINENFYVADAKSIVEPLLVAPDFVSNKLEGRKQGGNKGESSGSGTEQATTGGAAAESRPSTTPDPLPQLQFVATQDLGPQGIPVVLPPANGFIVVSPFGGVIFDDDVLSATFNSLNQLTAFGTLGTFPAGSLNGGSISDTGSLTLSTGQVVSWGRWTGNTLITSGTGSTVSGAPLLFGAASGVGNDSTAGLGGVATYTYAGGPRPVDAGGNVGNITSTTASINFTTQTAALTLGMDFPSIVASSVNTGPASFSLSGSGVRNGGDFNGGLTGTCTGTGCLASTASGFFEAGTTGAGGYEFAVFGGLVSATNAGAVAFLNAYLNSSFTPGPPPVVGTTPVSALTFAFSGPGIDIADLAEVSNSPTGQLQLDTTGTRLEGASDLNHPIFGNVSINRNSAAFADLGSDSTEGTVFWGRWGQGAVATSTFNGTLVPPTGIHWFFGPATAHSVIAAKTGTINYLPVGGTNPTHSSGVAGTFNTSSLFTVNFTALTISGSLLYSVAGNSYNLSVPPTTPIVNSNGTATFGIAPGGVAGFCSPSCGSITGFYSVGGVFTGATGTGLGVTYATDHPNAGQTAGAQFFKQ